MNGPQLTHSGGRAKPPRLKYQNSSYSTADIFKAMILCNSQVKTLRKAYFWECPDCLTRSNFMHFLNHKKSVADI